MEEYFDIVDENGNPTGETIERKEAHRKGILHRTAHVWIARRRKGRVELLLQKRCQDKDSFPGCYDISSAGHIPAGADYIESALRELKEELGINVTGDMLQECGFHRMHFDDVFHGEEFIDNQLAKVYLMWLDKEAGAFTVQAEEIDSVMWIDFEECKKAVENNSIPNCIDLAELHMLETHF